MEFRSPASLFVVCEYCRCSSYRRDAELEKIGVLAERAPLASHFQIGTRGRYNGVPFEVRGQLQLDHGRGLWNEWCAETGEGGWLWIAEAQGEIWVLEERSDVNLPEEPPAEVKAGDRMRLVDGVKYLVTEVGHGRVVTAAGELPVRIAVGERTTYADLRSGSRDVATLDWTRDREPELLAGREVEVGELDLDASTQPEHTPVRVKAKRVVCVNCQAPIELHDPDGTLRVACESCGTVIERKGELLKAVAAQKKLKKPRLPLGQAGELRGERLRVLGMLTRYVVAYGRRYTWYEYLLRREDGSYRWLIENQGHWVYARPVSPDAVQTRGRQALYRGDEYRRFTRGKPKVAAVLGEFYWDVAVGDEVLASDYVFETEMVATERSDNEIAAVHGVHADRKEIVEAFGIKRMLPAPRGVGMIQPNRARPKPAVAVLGVAAALLIVLRVVIGAGHQDRLVLNETFGPVPASSSTENAQFTDPFELTASKGNLLVRLYVPELTNGWVGIDGALVNEETGAVTTFGLDTEYYKGVTGGESWSEGDRDDSTWIGSVAAGRYRMRFSPIGFEGGHGQNYRIEVRSQVPRTLYLFLTLLVLAAWPAAVALRWFFTEKRRWDESDHPWFESSD